ncbi:tRNA dimethylallyltransferase [hydrothermal vent metagenome]|uniref:tRNA dimethylallyltransferase n=1 Tax=hydrothermal vent metagenome TaxID=652676 RepID=A0A3B1AH53_9ZZZZ
MGPTASGKTSIAIELVKQLPVDIISVDSALIYRDMNIGTAKPDVETLAQAPHRLIDIIDASESYSVAQFCTDALREMKDIVSRNRIPLLVGGTMLYYKALRYGLSDMPSSDPVIREKLELQAAEKGWHYMHEKLMQVDPRTAARLHPNDPQRIQRALEVYEISGKTISQFHEESQGHKLDYNIIDVVVAPAQRCVLHANIEIRFNQMIHQGLIDEVSHFYNRGDLSLDNPSMRCVGYRQVWEYLEGKLSKSEMIERAIIGTRQLAKRQFTWLRSESPNDWIDSLDKSFLTKALKKIRQSPYIVNI